MWEWIVKLIGGWLPTGTKPFGEWLGKIVWCVGIVLMVGLATNLFEKFFPSKTPVTNIGQGGTQIIYQEQRDTAGIGCNAWRGYLRMGIKQK